MSTKIHWQEGLFLKPHHLQRMQKSVEDEIASERRLAWAHPYGGIEARGLRGGMGNKRIRFYKLRAVMPSGLGGNFPAAGGLPPPGITPPFFEGGGTVP